MISSFHANEARPIAGLNNGAHDCQIARIMRRNKAVMTLYVCLYCTDVSYRSMIAFNESQPEGLAIGGHFNIKFNFETKKFLKFHSRETKKHLKFHSKMKEYVKFHCGNKGPRLG